MFQDVFQNMKKMLRTDETLQEMLLAMPVFGLLCQLAFVWFVSDKAAYAVGLWAGIVAAACMALHMTCSLEKALAFDADTAQKLMVKSNLIRYVCVAVFLAVTAAGGLACMLAAFLGLMSLKVSAYLQPFTHKLVRR